MKVRAKFMCNAVTEYVSGKEVQLMAVQNGSEENKSFATYTPSASLKMSISPETEAVNYFIVGREYYLDFIECNPQPENSGDV